MSNDCLVCPWPQGISRVAHEIKHPSKVLQYYRDLIIAHTVSSRCIAHFQFIVHVCWLEWSCMEEMNAEAASLWPQRAGWWCSYCRCWWNYVLMGYMVPHCAFEARGCVHQKSQSYFNDEGWFMNISEWYGKSLNLSKYLDTQNARTCEFLTVPGPMTHRKNLSLFGI